MSDRDSFKLIMLVLIVLVGLAFYILGAYVSVSMSQRSAIEAGVAQWTVDPKTGATTFEWRRCE